MQTRLTPPNTESPPTGRRAGYVVAAAVNAALIYVAHNLLAWDLLPFLTNEFERVLPIITVSLAATILFNVIHLSYDPAWFKSFGQIVVAAVSLAAAIQMYRVFPFDFAAYEFNWTAVARGVLILAMVGTGIGILVEGGKLARRAASP